MEQTGTPRRVMTESDYESVLKRVATKTGYSDIHSLWHYIDIVWNEIDVWGGVDRAVARLHAADRLYDELLALKHDLETSEASPAVTKVLQGVANRLKPILESAKDDFDSGERELDLWG